MTGEKGTNIYCSPIMGREELDWKLHTHDLIRSHGDSEKVDTVPNS